MVNVPWSTPFSRWTQAFERLALEVLQMANSIQSACQLLRIGHDTAQTIMSRAVTRGMARRGEEDVECAGIDEKSLGRGHDYVTVLTDINGKRVMDVARGATKEAVRQLVTSLPKAQQQSIKAVAMDRSPTFVAATKAELPHSVIVHDPYHLSADVNKALDKVRREEHRALLSEGDRTLVNTKYQWLRNPLKMDEEQMASFAFLTRLNLKTARAWQIKELFASFWYQPDEQAGAAFFEKWYRRTRRSRLEPMKKLAASFKASLPRMLTWFSYRISNAMAEGYNSAIQAIKAAARGFRSFENYRTRILFMLGKLDLSLP
jgi:transposase